VVDLEGAPQRRTNACAFANRASAGCGPNSDTSGECQGAKGRSAFKAILIDPILADRAWSPARADEALIAIGTVTVRLAEALRVSAPAYSIALVPLQPEAIACGIGTSGYARPPGLASDHLTARGARDICSTVRAVEIAEQIEAKPAKRLLAADQQERLARDEDSPFLLLAHAVVLQARMHLARRCSRGCQTPDQCQRSRITEGRFLLWRSARATPRGAGSGSSGLNGRGITEVNGEYFARPFPERLRAYDGTLQYHSMIVYERGTRAASGAAGAGAGGADVLVRRRVGQGRTLYLNLTPLAYAYFPFRSGQIGVAWREVLGTALADAGLRARVEIYRSSGERVPWMESLLWRNANRYCLAMLKNPGDAAEPMSLIAQEPGEITVQLQLRVRGIRNVRTGKMLGYVSVFTDRFTPWEANLYEFALGE
jgi:hypothetical protein